MSERPIAVGDLVQIVRWPCCVGRIGLIFKVEKFWTAHTDCLCHLCGAKTLNSEPIAWDGVDGSKYAAPPSWLKRIPPLDELESTRTEDKHKEPA